MKNGVATSQTLDRAQNRDRGRDHAVAVEQRGSEDAEHDERRAKTGSLCPNASSQAHEGQDPALAPVVEAEDVDVVLERDDDDQGPEDQRQDAEHVGVVGRHAMQAVEAFANRVQRARADVAVDDPDREQGQRDEATAPGWFGPRVVGRHVRAIGSSNDWGRTRQHPCATLLVGVVSTSGSRRRRVHVRGGVSPVFRLRGSSHRLRRTALVLPAVCIRRRSRRPPPRRLLRPRARTPRRRSSASRTSVSAGCSCSPGDSTRSSSMSIIAVAATGRARRAPRIPSRSARRRANITTDAGRRMPP